MQLLGGSFQRNGYNVKQTQPSSTCDLGTETHSLRGSQWQRTLPRLGSTLTSAPERSQGEQGTRKEKVGRFNASFDAFDKEWDKSHSHVMLYLRE